MYLVFVLVCVIGFIVMATSKFKLHPFITLISAAFLTAFASGLDSQTIAKTITGGFGGILGYIGLVIVLGTIIGVILEKSGAAITMADTVVKLFGQRFPTLTMSIIGFIVSIPVFCDSGFVILNSLKESMAKRMKVSSVAMTVALSTGLFATHTFVPPTPGPIAGAGNLGLEDSLGLVIAIGLVVAAFAAFAGVLWANRFKNTFVTPQENSGNIEKDWVELKASYGKLPSAMSAFAPIFVPILLICLGSIARFPTEPFGQEAVFNIANFLGQPLNALIVGLVLSLALLSSDQKVSEFSDRITDGIQSAAPIILITGAGGAFGAVLKATEIGDVLGSSLSAMGVGIFMPFIVAAALKSAQGSSTVALVTTSALVAPMLGDLGLASEMGAVLTLMAIGAGAMTVSHANDSFFWVVAQFSKLPVAQAYRAHTLGTLVQGLAAISLVFLLSLILL